MNLPKLPIPDSSWRAGYEGALISYHSNPVIQAYGEACYRKAIEDCMNVIKDFPSWVGRKAKEEICDALRSENEH